LRGTSFDTEPLITGNHSRGYVRVGKRLVDVSVASPSPAWAAGAIVSTADDLERFFSALNQGKLSAGTFAAGDEDADELLRRLRTRLRARPGPLRDAVGEQAQVPRLQRLRVGHSDGTWQLVLFVNLESILTPKLSNAINQRLITALCRVRSR